MSIALGVFGCIIFNGMEWYHNHSNVWLGIFTLGCHTLWILISFHSLESHTLLTPKDSKSIPAIFKPSNPHSPSSCLVSLLFFLSVIPSLLRPNHRISTSLLHSCCCPNHRHPPVCTTLLSFIFFFLIIVGFVRVKQFSNSIF